MTTLIWQYKIIGNVTFYILIFHKQESIGLVELESELYTVDMLDCLLRGASDIDGMLT